MIKNRKHLRLTDWDYSSEGVYFVTICCHERQSCFGSFCDNEIIPSEIGKIASQFWLEIPNHFPHVKLDEFIIMPNHIHGILVLDYSHVGTRHGVSLHVPSNDNVGSCHGMTLPPRKGSNQNINKFSKPLKNSVSVVVNQYKSSVKRWCNKKGFSNFQWQSRFYDQILRSEISIEKIREYIYNNLINWPNDEFYQK
ncbi:MAG: transposase [Bacteroidales bacterium]